MPSNGLYINNGEINKRVAPEELEGYLAMGWNRGMKPRSKEQIDAANEKRKNTCLKKYGVENVHQLEEVKNKIKETCLSKYGVDNPAKNELIKEKTKKTNADKWPDPHNYHNLQQAHQTLLNNYGSMQAFYEWRYNNMDWEATIQKQIETKKKNNTFNYSQPEEDLYIELCKEYGKDNVIRNYKDDRYPFYCDFYIKNEDLFIELNRHWTHGGHPFDENNEEDIKKLEEWQKKALTSEYMQYAIINWTIRDPLKIKTAKENNLNYKIIW